MTAVLLCAALAAGCSGSCRALAEQVCSCFTDGGSGECAAKVEEFYDRLTAVKWEDEYRCDEYMRTCNCEGLKRGACQECGVAPFYRDAWGREMNYQTPECNRLKSGTF